MTFVSILEMHVVSIKASVALLRGVRSLAVMSKGVEGSSRVAVGQLCSTSDTASNFKKIRHLTERAKIANCQLLALPECFSFIGTSSSESV